MKSYERGDNLVAKNTIKGLTVEIGGDTTKLGKALEDVNKKSRDLSGELGQINRMLKLDPGNTELLAQKQKVLAEAVSNTAEKLDKLKEAEKSVQEQFERGEVSAEQVRELQREIIETERKLGSYERAIEETNEAVQNLGEASEEAADASEDLGGAMDSIANGGLAAVTGLVTASVAALTASAEATREYRTEMAKLDTAFTSNGHSSEAAVATYKALQGVLGETDQAVEAANHLALLAKNEKDLATWTDIAAGVYATFGASLPIEGLTEAANETAKVGKVTGPLADALNWAGVNEDKFNESLEKCNSEQERQALIMSTLSGLYDEASETYKENNADVIAANEANEAWMASMAQVGETVEPLITKVKLMGAGLVEKIVPVVNALLNNLPAVAVALGGIVAVLTSYKVAAIAATAAEKGMTLAQYAAAAAQKALNAAMTANPIGLVIVAITALVTAFVYLWNNCEDFRKFWINLWEKIKTTALSVADALKQLPDKIANAIRGALTKVEQWGTNMVSKAKAGMAKVVSTVTSTLKELPSKVLSIGGDLVKGLWQGVTDKLSWLKNKLKSFASSVLDGIKDFFGVHSPSRETAWIGDMLDQGLAEGVLDNADAPVKAMQRVSGQVLGAATGEVDGFAVSQQLHRSAAAGNASAFNLAGLGGKLDSILAAIERGQILTIDGKALIGGTIDQYDNALGQRRLLAERGAV